MSLRKMQLPSITWNRQREVAISRVGGSPTLATNYWLMDKIDRKRLPSQGKAPFHPSFSNKLHFLEKAMWNFQDVRLDGPVAPLKARTFQHKNSTKFSEKWVPPRGIHSSIRWWCFSLVRNKEETHFFGYGVILLMEDIPLNMYETL